MSHDTSQKDHTEEREPFPRHFLLRKPRVLNHEQSVRELEAILRELSEAQKVFKSMNPEEQKMMLDDLRAVGSFSKYDLPEDSDM
jgi:hypothetical protein